MELLNTVTISLEEYSRMRDELIKANNENIELNEKIQKLEEAEGQKVIVRTIVRHLDYDEITVEVKDADDIVEMLDAQLKEANENLEKKCENLEKANKDFAEATIKLDMEISRLMHRNLWQRIWNR